MRFDSGWTTGLLSLALCGVLPAAACWDAEPAVETETDAGPLRGEDVSPAPAEDARERRDAGAVGCPSSEPTFGTACSEGALRCPLRRHKDCTSPTCPPGCTYLGIAPGAQFSSGVSYYAVCLDGLWEQASVGDCAANKDAALCECRDQDAGQ